MKNQPTDNELNIAICWWMNIAPVLDWQVMSQDEASSCMSGERHECERWLEDLKRKYPDSQFASYKVAAWKRYPDHINGDEALGRIHKVAKTLRFTFRKKYHHCLQLVCSDGLDRGMVVVMEECIDATARQRALAIAQAVPEISAKLWPTPEPAVE